jgi:cytochrome c oxidase assembly protein subunit 11
MIDRKVTIRFDANVGPGLPWSFVPEQNSIEVKLGQVVTVHYRVVNQAARPITASAAYNVTPLSVGSYFNKINCFCFTEQSLKAGEKRELAVVFYVDPAMAKDSDGANVNTITLSYTFYQQREPYRPVADSTLPEKRGQI